MKTHRFLLGLVFLSLIGCSGNEDEATRAEYRGRPAWEGQMRVLDKARAVEQTMKDSAEEERRKIERQTQ